MKTLSETKQQCLWKSQTTHIQYQRWKVWNKYRADSRSVHGVGYCEHVHGLDLSVHEHKCDATAAADDNCSQNDALV